LSQIKIKVLDRYLVDNGDFMNFGGHVKTKIVLFLLLYLSVSFIQVYIPPAFSGIFAQLHVFLSILVVISTPKYGHRAAVILNAAQSVHITVLVFVAHRQDALPGMVVPLFTIITVSIISFVIRHFLMKHAEVLSQRTEILKAKEEAEQANSAKSNFLATMSHEIRTPVNSILGFLELISLGNLDDKQKDYMRIVTSNAQNLVALINDILDFSKIENNRLQLHTETFDPVEKIQLIVRSFENKALNKRIAVDFQYNETPLCKGDALRFGQVIINLFGNALKFTPENGRVDLLLHSSQMDQTLSLDFSITDTGIGISPDRQQIIFDFFAQGDTSIAGRYGGTGLGLAISSRIIAMMGGKLRVESELGKGSRFYFTIALPVALNAKRNALPIAGGTLIQRSCYALVAEDSPDSLKLLVLMLEKFGIVSDPVKNGREAYEHFAANMYDMILLDGSMPEMSGVDAARKIREYEQAHSRSRTPIIAVSAKAFSSEKEAFLNAGADIFVEKPVTLKALSEAIKKVPEKHSVCSEHMKDAANHESHFTRVAHSLGISEDAVRKIFTEFTAMMPEYLAGIDDALSPLDVEKLRKAAHRLKGSSASFFLDELTSASADLEKKAISNDTDDIQNAVDRVHDAAKKVFTVE